MFSIKRLGKGTNWETIKLSDEKISLSMEIVPSAGAILNSLYVGEISPVNIIAGYRDREDFDKRLHQGFWSAKLSPFVCRLHNANYRWNGRQYHLDKFLLNGSALHGLLYDAPFELVGENQGAEECSVLMRYQYDGNHPGYPFPFNCTVTYSLRKEGMVCINTHISNAASGVSALPLADGWHPYFSMGGKADEWWLQIASDQMLEYDRDLIPTGNYIRDERFAQGRLIGNLKLDNGFLLRENISPICTLRNPANGLFISFLSQKNYPFLQLYIPDQRDSIAIENLSSAPDAFNNGIGLITLEPGEKVDFEVQIKVG